jgi:signal transduction histidine kinase
LTLSALVLGGAALLLLHREQNRLRTALGDAERTQIEAAANHVASSVQLLEDQLGALLTSGAWQELDSLERTNPLVRNVFVFDPEAHMLRLPDPNAPGSTEEAGFLRRYRTLFSERHFWHLERDPADANRWPLFPNLRRTQYQTAQGYVPGFWLPWTSDNSLHIIGGVQPVAGGPVYGVEIEMMTLIARLSIQPEPHQSHSRSWRGGSHSYETPPLALLDGGARMLCVADSVPDDPRATPDFQHPIGSLLPHWQLAVYRRPQASRNATTLTQAAIALVCTMVVGILGAGAALFADSRRSRRDARQRTTFVANVSHELKTPLTSIRMYAELLRDNRVPNEERRQRFLDTMVQEGERLTRLIDNVLDFGRLEQSRRNYHLRPFDLAETLHGIVDVERARLREAGLELAEEVPGRVPVKTDPDVIRQIVLNLLDNATKYATGGKTVCVSLSQFDGQVHVSVRDDGPGIPANCRERVFGMFERLDNSLEARAGSGLGLAIARGLARGLGGDLVCRSVQPHGACFTLSLPVEETR